MSEKRRDNKKRLLWEGEVQEQNGRYKYRYTDSNGKRKSVYSWRLTSTDPFPAGKKPDLSLREKEQIIQKEVLNGVCSNDMTVMELSLIHI